MKIPKKLKIGSQEYKIYYTNIEVRGGNDTLGETWLKENRIYISNVNSALTQQEETFFHEIMEVINYTYQLKLEHKDISIISEAYYQTLKDNKLLK